MKIIYILVVNDNKCKMHENKTDKNMIYLCYDMYYQLLIIWMYYPKMDLIITVIATVVSVPVVLFLYCFLRFRLSTFGNDYSVICRK